MQIDFNQTIQSIYGATLRELAPDPDDPDKSTEQDVTLRKVAVGALLINERDMDGKTKLSRYLLAKRVQESNGTLDISVKEAALLQKQIGRVQNPLVVGQCLPMLEGEPRKS